MQDISQIMHRIHEMTVSAEELEEMEFDENRTFKEGGYELDSVGFLSVSVHIKREYGVDISPEDWREVDTLKSLALIVQQKLAAK